MKISVAFVQYVDNGGPLEKKKKTASFLVLGKLFPVLYIFNAQLWHLFYPDYSDFLAVLWWEILEETFVFAR